MELKISIKTPEGQATGTEQKFRKFILGDKKKIHKTWVSPKDDEIIWEVAGDIREVMKVQRNLFMFDKMVKGLLDNKLMKKTMRSKLDEKGEKELTDMLKNHTKIEVIKQATAEELVEEGKTWWTKVKEKFRRVD